MAEDDQTQGGSGRPEGSPSETPGVAESQEARVADRARSEHERMVRRARQARVAKVLAALAVVVIVIIFITANSQGVPVDFVFVTRRPPLIWIMIGCILLGGIGGYFVGRPGKELRRRRKRDRSAPAG